MLLCVTVIIPFVLEILFKVPAADAEGFFFFIFLKQKLRWFCWEHMLLSMELLLHILINIGMYHLTWDLPLPFISHNWLPGHSSKNS